MIRNSLKKVMIIGLLTFLGTVTIQAQSRKEQKYQDPPSIAEIFEQMDANEDGKLSKKEIKGPLKKDFSKIDTNEDGFLTKEELRKAPKPKRRGGKGKGRPARN